MKIVEAISDMNIGGAGILLLNRLTTDAEHRSNTVVVIPKGSALKERLVEEHIEYAEIDACKDRSFELSAIPKYIRLLRVISPEIINCHGMLSFRLAAYMCNIPVRIYTRHCTYPLKAWQKSFVYRKLAGHIQTRLSHGIIAVADVVKRDLIYMGVPSDRITVIINGVHRLTEYSDSQKNEIKRSLSIPTDATVVGIFARLEYCKDHKCLIDAAKLLIKRYENYRFLIVGGGSLEKKLKNMCREAGLLKHVIFTGFVDDVTPYFNITDINVNCSVGTETSSLALSEGMSLSVPCVASDYGGNVYMVRDGINGLIYNRGDHEELAEKIDLLRRDAELYTRLSYNARKRFCEELNANKMATKTYELYNKLYDINASR